MKKILFGVVLMLITSIASSATVTLFYGAGSSTTNLSTHNLPTNQYAGAQYIVKSATDANIFTPPRIASFDYWQIFVGAGDIVSLVFDNAKVDGLQNIVSPLQNGGFTNLTSYALQGGWRTFQVARGGTSLDPNAMDSKTYSYSLAIIVNGVNLTPAPPPPPPPVTTVPEPNTLLLLGIALIGIAIFYKKRIQI